MRTLQEQAERIVELGVHDLGGWPAEQLYAEVERLPDVPNGVLVVSPSWIPASRLAPLLSRAGKPGFVVEDMTDLDEFAPITGVDVPDGPLYVVGSLDRGADMLNWSPDEALPVIAGRGRTPLTVSEGISWLLQEPEQLEPNRCFMTIASRQVRKSGPDARVPALWISRGTGRDGRDRRGAPKVGWCWARNRHTWLGFASAEVRVGARATAPASGTSSPR